MQVPVVQGAPEEGRGDPTDLPLGVSSIRGLRHGTYLLQELQISAEPIVGYLDGTLRVERLGFTTVASGDLYFRRFGVPGTNSAAGIPIHPRANYRYYLRVTQIEGISTTNSITLGFERYRFNAASASWTNEGAFTAQMTWRTAPVGYPDTNQYLTGAVKDSAGAIVGSLFMGWVSPFLRRATVEIDRVNVSEAPLNNGAGIGWKEAFAGVGWDINLVQSDTNIAEPSGEGWSDAEMHAAMLARRASSNLDAEWRYHVLCVRRIDSTPRGIMYDAFAGDTNNVPREGVGISSHWVIPNTNEWGLVAGRRFGTAAAPYFRTVIHELGHAMGLYHNTVDNGFMNTTDVIANAGTPANPFPTNIRWAFATDDAKRLRHMPDPWVRPGGIAFGNAYGTAPLSPGDREELAGVALRVSALRASVPIGAPVRVELSLSNDSDQPVTVPASLSLKKGFVQGRVIDPSGTVRTFRPLVRCVEEHSLRTLEPRKRMTDSLTLLRGAEGALFPAPGAYTIAVDVSWEENGLPVGVTAQTQVMVMGAVDQDHAEAALKILSTPDALLTLALGGDHMEEGIAAIQAGLDNPVLRPHFAFIEAKRLGQRFFQRPPELDTAVRLIEEDTVLSSSELKKAAGLVKQAAERAATRDARERQAAQVLRNKVKEVDADAATLTALEQL